MRTLLIPVPILLLAACAAPQPRPAAPAPAPAIDTAALVIPVPADTGDPGAPHATLATMGQLAARAAQGDVDAAWTRAHYLLDLFDDARFRGDARSLDLLHQAAGTADGPRRGPAATDAVLRALGVAVDQVLAQDRLHAPALAARTLIDFDARPPARAEVFQRTSELRAIGRGAGALAANARLRLFGYCRQALADAMRARWADRVRVMSHCLYALYDADPAPYFAEDPAARPPPPRWQDLLEDLARLLAPVADAPSAAAGSGHLAAAARSLLQDLEPLAAAAAGALPSVPDPVALGLPRVAGAPLHDFTPLVVLGDGQDTGALDDIEALTRAVQGDGRRTLAVALAAGAPADLVLRAARAAASAGATRLELLAATEQALVVPPGDYWSGRLPARQRDGQTNDQATDQAGSQTALRLAVIELSLATLDSGALPSVRTSGWDPARARLGLHLVVGPDAWVLTSPTGAVATVAAPATGPGAGALEAPGAPGASSAPTAAAATDALRAALARLSRAFADEDALILVPGPKATVGALVAAAAAVSRDHAGRPLVTRLGLAARAPASRARDLARRIGRRADATAVIVPDALAARTSMLRRCYQDVLERQPRAGGAFRLERRGDAVTITEGPRDQALRDCVRAALAPAMLEQQIPSATATLRPRP